jgi:site-specific DNA recombinase
VKIVIRFSDRAKSGSTLFDRDGLLDLMAAAKARKFDTVIVESLDRLSRDQEDLAGLFKRLKHYEIDLLTVNEGLTTDIHVGVRGIVGSMFIRDLAAKIKRGQGGRVLEGNVPGVVTYGYDRVPGKPGERVINEGHAAIIRREFTEYAAGISPRAIAAGLTRDGIPTPTGGTEWNHQCFVSGGGIKKGGMLGNRVYIGELIWNKHRTVRDPDTGSESRRERPQADHITVAVPHLRIIDQALWDAAQAIRAGRSFARIGATGAIIRRPVVARSPHPGCSGAGCAMAT